MQDMSIQNVGFVVRREGRIAEVKLVSADRIIRIGSARSVELRLQGEGVCQGHATFVTQDEVKATLASSIVSSPVVVDGNKVGACDIFDRGIFEIGSNSIQVFFDPKEGDMPNVEVTN